MEVHKCVVHQRNCLQNRHFQDHHHIIGYATFPIKCAAAHLIGTIAGYRFNALVFPAHAECPEYELGDSRISKLWLERIADRATVLNFDRG